MLAVTVCISPLPAGTRLSFPVLPPSSRLVSVQSGSRPAPLLDNFLAKTERLQSTSPVAAVGRSQPLVRMASSSAKTVLVPIGNGSEEMEAVTIIDVMRRAGASVTVASVESDLTVQCSRDVRIVADALITQVAEEQYDLIVLPGGAPGSEALKRSEDLKNLLQKQQSSNKPYAAMCAAPAVVLQAHGLLKGKKATAHPAFVDSLSDSSAAEQRVVVDGNLVTSRGPGTALEFALALVEQLYGSEKAREVAGPMVVQNNIGSFMHA